MAKRQNVNAQQGTDKGVSPEIPRELIAQRAYSLYLARGSEDGHDVADWLQAERELAEEAAESEKSPSEVSAA